MEINDLLLKVRTIEKIITYFLSTSSHYCMFYRDCKRHVHILLSIAKSISYTHVYIQNFDYEAPEYSFSNNFLTLMQETFLPGNIL